MNTSVDSPTLVAAMCCLGIYWHSMSSRYRTIMSYDCDDVDVPEVPYFSNPDIEYLDLPTGTEEADNARCIRDNMVRFANVR